MTEIRNTDVEPPLLLTEDMRVAVQQAALQKKKPPAPFSIRLTFEERARLESAAGGMPLGAYIRQKLFDGELSARRVRGRNPIKDHAELAQVLGALGQSRLSNNLNQIAKAAHIGALPVTPDLEAELKAACEDIRSIRADLMRALGFPGSGGDAP